MKKTFLKNYFQKNLLSENNDYEEETQEGSKNVVFCFPCRKFGNDHGYSDEAFVKTGFINWILKKTH